MPKIDFEDLVLSMKEDQTKLIIVEPQDRPSWPYILHFAIAPLCELYGLIIEYGDENDESVAIFYGDGLPF